ncbi:MAG: hypothetical protein C5B49_11145 [Bdellovibrio sp.]|nr:MAG: hypothetical protein C5B49_11145 [Bdellovibrio sp.]
MGLSFQAVRQQMGLGLRKPAQTSFCFVVAMNLLFSEMRAWGQEPLIWDYETHYNLNPFTPKRGFKMGFIDDSEEEGYWPIRTLEGRLLLGSNSTIRYGVDHNCVQAQQKSLGPTKDSQLRNLTEANVRELCKVETNPWHFSTLYTSLQERIDERLNGPVVIYFAQWSIMPFTVTNQIAYNVWSANRPIPLVRSVNVIDEFPFSGEDFLNYKSGEFDGRIVEASVDGFARESYLLQIQRGPSGNDFVWMNVSSTRLYNFIVQAMLTSRLLRIYFLYLYEIFEIPGWLLHDYRTYFRVYRVDILDDAAAKSMNQ